VASGNDVTIKDINALDLSASTVSGNLNVTAGGAITESGALIVNGAGKTATFAAGAGNDITLHTQNNDFNTVAITSGKNVTLNDINAIDLGASTVSGTLTVIAAGNITESGALNVTAGGSAFAINGVTADILLGSQANNFDSQSVFITSINGGTVQDVSFRNVDAGALVPSLPASLRNLSLQFDAAGMNLPTLNLSGNLTVDAAGLVDFVGTGASSIAGTLNVTTSAGGIDDSGPGTLTVAGLSTLNAGAGNNITLNNNNDFSTVVVTSGKDVTLNDQNGLNLGNLAVSGNLGVTAAGLVDFVGAGASTVAGNASITSAAIDDSGSGTLAVNGTTTLNAGAGDITLDNNNDFNTVVVASANNVSLHDQNAINLGNLTVFGNLGVTAGGKVDFISAGTSLIFGGLNVTTPTGGIDDSGSGNLVVFGSSTLDAGAANNINLDNAGNDFNTVSITSGKDVTLRDVSGLNLGNLAVSGNLGVTAGGLVDLTGAGASTVGGTLGITSSGINDSGSGSLSVNGVTTLAAGASDITLDNNNNFSTVVINSGNNVTLKDQNAINLGNLALTGNLGVTAGGLVDFVGTGASTVGGNVAVSTPTGGITDSGSGTLNFAGTTTLDAGAANNITLDNNNNLNVVTINSGKDVVLNDVDAITVGGNVSGNLNTVSGGGTTFNTLGVSGNLGATAGGVIGFNAVNVGGNLTATTPDAITFNTVGVGNNLTVTAGGAIGESGPVTVGSLASFASSGAGGNGNIILNNGGNNFGSIALSSVSGSTVIVTEGSGTTLANVAVNAGSLTVNSGGDITQVPGDSIVVGGPTTLTAPGGNSVNVGNAGNTFNGPVNFAANGPGNLLNVFVHDTTDFDISGVTVDDTFSLTSEGAGGVTQSGAINAPNLQVTAAGPVTLNGLNSVGTIAGKVTGPGNSFSFTDLSILTVGTVDGVNGISTENGNVTLTADQMNLASGIDTTAGIGVNPKTGDVLLQSLNPNRDIVLGAKVPGKLSFSQDEVNRVTTDQLQIGNTDAGGISGFNTVTKPDSIKDFIAVGNGTTISIASGQIAGLSAVTIPAPRLDSSTFSGSQVTAEEAAKLLPAGAIGTLWLQVPFVQTPEDRYRLEDVSKWTGGRVAAAGTTTGPQTGK
ncbi:MAG TPA: hypothetical protein VMZ27_06695, partial [Candidatus Saccharimonadales bacterium]|nr:hypothetical protein [Candidatus Saccharimonadales bacterium]